MKELERPLKEHFEQETDVGTALATFDYIRAIDKYCDQLEKERDILKEAVKIYKSGRYPSLAMLDKIEELIK